MSDTHDHPTCDPDQQGRACDETPAARSEFGGHTHDGHDHDLAASSSVRLAVAFGITATILIAEIVGAYLTDSLSLLVDAGHMVTDALGLAVALAASRVMLRPPTKSHTWGLRRIEVLAAGAQATVLLGVGLYAIVTGILRLLAPPDIHAQGLLIFGVIGLAGNIISILVLSGGRDASLNMKAAFLEVVNDALGSVAVIVAALAIRFTGWTQADAVAGLFIAGLILPRAVRIIRDAARILLEAVPAGIDVDEVSEHLKACGDHVLEIYDLHVSLMDSNMPILSAHVVVEDECFQTGHAPEILHALQACVAENFGINHSTFQLETALHAGHQQLHATKPSGHPGHHHH